MQGVKISTANFQQVQLYNRKTRVVDSKQHQRSRFNFRKNMLVMPVSELIRARRLFGVQFMASLVRVQNSVQKAKRDEVHPRAVAVCVGHFLLGKPEQCRILPRDCDIVDTRPNFPIKMSLSQLIRSGLSTIPASRIQCRKSHCACSQAPPGDALWRGHLRTGCTCGVVSMSAALRSGLSTGSVTREPRGRAINGAASQRPTSHRTGNQ